MYDVGAGAGQVTKYLRNAGFDVRAFDLYARDNADIPDLEVEEGGSYPYEPGSVVMLCRPCHGDFVDRTIRRAVQCGVAAIVYVGLRKNLAIDLGGYRKRFRSQAQRVGRDRESLYLWQPE